MNTENNATGEGKERGRDVIVKTISRLMVPFIQLFGLYVGGFQGGVIFAASFILLVVSFGIVDAGDRFPEAVDTVLFSLGTYIFAGVGLLCIILSYGAAQYLNYGFLPLPVHFEERRALSIELMEIGIVITVMAVITSIFFNLAWKRESKEVGGEKEEQE